MVCIMLLELAFTGFDAFEMLCQAQFFRPRLTPHMS